jgi:Protein of unknown function (DUF3040)
MFVMSLPIGQQRALESIEGKLAESDPRLTSLFATFTRLTRAEQMPWIEQVAVSPVAGLIAMLAARFRWLARRPAARVRAMVLLPAALTATACALTIAFGFPGSQRHVPGVKAPTARELVVRSRDLMAAKSRLCRNLVRMPAFSC